MAPARHLNSTPDPESSQRRAPARRLVTAQPTSVTITAGNSFSLVVTATGDSLAYQWSKGGVDIPGATTATYTKSSATTADAGTYSVLVSNSAGRVRSNTATVIVNTATTTPPSPSSSSKGGGGGGALDLNSLLGLLALLATRRFFSCTSRH